MYFIKNKGSTYTDILGHALPRCPIARPRTLLVYEGNESHVIKNMAATVKFFSPHKVSTATVRCRHVTSYFLLYPLLYGVALSDSVNVQCSMSERGKLLTKGLQLNLKRH